MKKIMILLILLLTVLGGCSSSTVAETKGEDNDDESVETVSRSVIIEDDKSLTDENGGEWLNEYINDNAEIIETQPGDSEIITSLSDDYSIVYSTWEVMIRIDGVSNTVEFATLECVDSEGMRRLAGIFTLPLEEKKPSLEWVCEYLSLDPRFSESLKSCENQLGKGITEVNLTELVPDYDIVSVIPELSSQESSDRLSVVFSNGEALYSAVLNTDFDVVSSVDEYVTVSEPVYFGEKEVISDGGMLTLGGEITVYEGEAIPFATFGNTLFYTTANGQLGVFNNLLGVSSIIPGIKSPLALCGERLYFLTDTSLAYFDISSPIYKIARLNEIDAVFAAGRVIDADISENGDTIGILIEFNGSYKVFFFDKDGEPISVRTFETRTCTPDRLSFVSDSELIIGCEESALEDSYLFICTVKEK